jgi:hypothetical protein
LSRTFGTPTSQNVYTWSGWIKRGKLGVLQNLFGVSTNHSLGFPAADTLVLTIAGVAAITSTAVYRDPSAWYHILYSQNGTAASLQVNNGTAMTATVTSAVFNTAVLHQLGAANTSNYADGYMAEVHFIDGQVLTPSDFGETNSDGVWVPKKYTGTYGTNGFYLPFSNGASLTTLGYDSSGNGNDWTLNNLSLTAGATYDWMLDTPTNNYAVLNALYTGKSTLSNCNLTASGTTDLPTLIPASGTYYFEVGGVSTTWTPPAAFPSAAGDYNFGQRPFTNAATNPTLCTSNLPTTAIANPQEHHNVYTVTKSGSTNFAIDWDASVYDTYFEIKRRDLAGDWYNVDGLRGYDKILKSNSTAAETTDANVISVSGTTCTLGSTLADGTYVISAWKAGLTAARQTNTDGSITSTVSRNVTSGFAIVTATGTAANATVGHGLGVVPKLIVSKARAAITEWPVYHGSLANTEYIVLNTTAAKATGATYWNSTTPISSVFSLGSSTNTNNAGGMVFYVHAEIPGYSKFASYTGNGSTDGPFVSLGFKPVDLTVKYASSTGSWHRWDALRDQYNLMGKVIFPNGSYAESLYASPDPVVDFIASGAKHRGSYIQNNASGGTYIFSAYADEPTGGANVAPSPAR